MTSAGLVRAHGPLSNRCPGSNEPPARTQRADVQLSPQRADDVQLSPPEAPVSSPAGSESSTNFSFRPGKILKRVPRASREQCLTKLSNLLESVVANNNLASWERLMRFPTRCLRVPSRCGRRWSLATMVNKQLSKEEDPAPTPRKPSRRRVVVSDP